MANKVVIGAQWGDEGKAKITDLLAQDADLIKHSNSTLYRQEFYTKAKLA